ncbi:MAG: flagellar hook-basal body complex protein FliE [ANME-2 cluster archaeon]|jgi:dephospho-CoA kinase|nr:MAG: flagellar hook-basal body complex protein FliE [ANME-2 cluster archaeon]
MRIIAFVGMPASGKSEAARVAKRRGIPVVVMGDAVREEAEGRGLDPSDVNIGGLADQLRAAEGMDAIAKRCVPAICKLYGTADTVVIDGIRGLSEVDRFRCELGDDFMLIAIDTPINIRLKRISGRKRSDAITSMESLKARDEREMRWGIVEAIASADHVIRNAGKLGRFRRDVNSLLSDRGEAR